MRAVGLHLLSTLERQPTNQHFWKQSNRLVGTLVLAEARPDGTSLANGSLNTIAAAALLGKPVTALVAGHNVGPVVDEAAKIQGVDKVLVAEHASLKDQLPETLTALVKALQTTKNYDFILSPASSWGKALIPRLGALLGIQPVSDVVKILDPQTFVRPIYAGNALSTVKYRSEGVRILTIRPAAFKAPEGSSGSTAGHEAIPQDVLSAAVTEAESGKSKLLGRQLTQSDRPELASARVVVCGGRALKSADNFKMLESLADALGGAVGASRAAVDAGMVPNDLQIGQTGKVVAPDLYIGIGISGAIQHLAGIKDAKTIVAINNNPEAEIFHVADYGLVADLFEAVPEMEKEVRKLQKSS